MPLVIYGPWGRHTHIHIRMHSYPHERDFKKPGTFWPACAWFKNASLLLSQFMHYVYTYVCTHTYLKMGTCTHNFCCMDVHTLVCT